MVIVRCGTCGATFDSPPDEVLSAHAIIHYAQDESMRRQFNDSAITLPIEYYQITEGEDDGR
jgi:hypothetical protein